MCEQSIGRIRINLFFGEGMFVVGKNRYWVQNGQMQPLLKHRILAVSLWYTQFYTYNDANL